MKEILQDIVSHTHNLGFLNVVKITGDKKTDGEQTRREVLHQGIAARGFVRRFQLADHVQVTGAALENGLLHIDLVREVPEAKKPRLIPIAANSTAKVIEANAA